MPDRRHPARTSLPRGRPLKFGRSSQLVTLTLPDDVVAWLKGLHPDPAWALVKLFERARKTRADASRQRPVTELAELPGRRALILVQPDLFKDLPGISLIPLQDGRALLALEAGRGFADLEIAILDRLDSLTSPEQRDALGAVRALLKRWRHERVRFEIRSIIVAERGPSSVGPPQPLAELRRRRAPSRRAPQRRIRSTSRRDDS